MHPGRDAVTPPSVVLHLMGSRQGNRGPPLPPPQIGCLCWLRHMGLAGPGRSVPRTGRWRRLPSCRSAAELQPLVWSPSPLRVLVEGWRTGVTTSGERGQQFRVRRRGCFNATSFVDLGSAAFSSLQLRKLRHCEDAACLADQEFMELHKGAISGGCLCS